VADVLFLFDLPVSQLLQETRQLGWTLAGDVDATAPDPAATGVLGTSKGNGRRRCIAQKRGGGRCGGPAVSDHLLCSMHARRADPADGGRRKAAAIRARNARAEDSAVLRRMGTREVIAQTLLEDVGMSARRVRW
jgi:hypothetical protein